MIRMFEAAWVIARRDFVATVWSRSFILFLLAPIIALAFGFLIAKTTGTSDRDASRPVVAIATDIESADAIMAAYGRLSGAFDTVHLPRLERIDPAEDAGRQIAYLLASTDRNVSAVLTGSLDRPLLSGPEKSLETVAKPLALVIEDARRTALLPEASPADRPSELRQNVTGPSAGSLNMVRHLLARGGQTLIFFLTLMLATMLLSNLVEEKSNKVIEVLAAAVPLDSVFLGKLIAMLGASVVGVIIWGGLAGIGLLVVQDFIEAPINPAVGWPAYTILFILYFAANYMLLGAVFLGIGGQASNVREVQTLSMPITFVQVMIFALASAVVGDNGGAITFIAAAFPLSSPMAMMALAAQSPSLWPHLLALLWQVVWIALIIRLFARLFRSTVLKSGNRTPFFSFRRTRA